MNKFIVAMVMVFCLGGCLPQHVNPSWEEGNLSKQEHLRRELDRVESEQMDTKMFKDIMSPKWGE